MSNNWTRLVFFYFFFPASTNTGYFLQSSRMISVFCALCTSRTSHSVVKDRVH